MSNMVVNLLNRNTLSHEVNIGWENSEDNALDNVPLISLIH
jgi:hypothetical protein